MVMQPAAEIARHFVVDAQLTQDPGEPVNLDQRVFEFVTGAIVVGQFRSADQLFAKIAAGLTCNIEKKS